MATQTQWRIKPASHQQATRLAGELGLSPLIAQLLVQRGLDDPGQAETFLTPKLDQLTPPNGLRGLQRACQVLTPAITGGRTIGVAGDYDADGVTATALMVEFLERSGAKVVWDLPHRLKDGYGFSPQAAERLAAAGARVLVTVDCGVGDQAGVDRARELGLEVVVTDHHQLPPEGAVDACAVINPQRPDCGFSHHLAGVGVAFYLAVGLRIALRQAGWFNGQRPEPNLRNSLDLVALGTCADVVPLLGDNRLLVAEGLKVAGESRRLGINALLRLANRRGPLSTSDLGFALAPRLNAAGRMASPDAACELLLSNDSRRVLELARELDNLNQDRRALESDTLAQAQEMLASDPQAAKAACLVLARPGWHRGVLGIVASRLMDATNRPVVLLAVENGLAQGSGRSLPGFHLQRALADLAGELVSFGGHELAAGLKVRTDRVPLIAQGLDRAASASLPAMAGGPVLDIDLETDLSQLDDRFLHDLKRLAPFGAGHPEPTVCLRGLRVDRTKPVGDGHLKLWVSQNGARSGAIAFNWDGPAPGAGQVVDLAAKPQPSTFYPGQLDLVVTDLKPV
jgi:single-stranded-DNA-specific exonuclease